MADKGLVLIVDDEPGILETLAGVFSDQGFRTLQTGSGEEALALYRERDPDVVFLDIWLPDRDGLETLQAIREHDPAAAVVMMSGHGTTSTAVKALKMGALDYLEKPLSYGQAVEAVNGGMRFRQSVAGGNGGLLTPVEPGAERLDTDRRLEAPPRFALVREGSQPQRTIGQSTVLYGLGLHSGRRTGMSLHPLPPDHGIHFITLPTNTRIPAHVAAVGETTYATTLEGEADARVSTVEHLLSALHAAGVTNLLVKVHGEIPVLDGSALEFCQTLEEVGVQDQPALRSEVVIDLPKSVIGEDSKSLRVEPYEGFAVSYLLRYPPPVGEQRYEYELTDFATYKQEIAPARTFGFLKDVKMMNELGLGSGGRIDNCILVGEDEVINTELRFADEFVRHKILDIIGDLYLLGYPLRGKVTARLSGHRFNIDLLRRILADA